VKTIEGKAQKVEGRFAVIVARFNKTITGRLLDGAIHTLTANGIDEANIDVVWAPGSFELPLVADRLAASGRYAAIIALGAVIKGETSHDEHINRAVSTSLIELGLRHSIPAIFGVLTCNTLQQANARSGAGDAGSKDKAQGVYIGNKGCEAAEAALEMVDLIGQLPQLGNCCCCGE
jgi:6,7-dimethyl-8-ribityllumazine synthase